MTIHDQIRDEKLRYNINREAAKISALSSSKIHKYAYVTSEDILPQGQVKTFKTYAYDLKILHLSQNKTKYLMNL